MDRLTGLWGLTVKAQCLSACLPPRHPNRFCMAQLQTKGGWHRHLAKPAFREVIWELTLAHFFRDFSDLLRINHHMSRFIKCHGMHHILGWIAHYSTSLRSQYMCVNGSSSSTLPVTSVVSQLSVFGPLLFTFYTNDISYMCSLVQCHNITLC